MPKPSSHTSAPYSNANSSARCKHSMFSILPFSVPPCTMYVVMPIPYINRYTFLYSARHPFAPACPTGVASNGSSQLSKLNLAVKACALVSYLRPRGCFASVQPRCYQVTQCNTLIKIVGNYFEEFRFPTAPPLRPRFLDMFYCGPSTSVGSRSQLIAS